MITSFASSWENRCVKLSLLDWEILFCLFGSYESLNKEDSSPFIVTKFALSLRSSFSSCKDKKAFETSTEWICNLLNWWLIRVPWNRKLLRNERKRKKEDKNIKNKEKNKKKKQKQNANSAGRSYSAPKPVWELLDHLETKLSVYWVLKYQVGGGGGWGALFYWECNRGFPAKNKGNESCKELTKQSTRGILPYAVMADGFICWSSLMWFVLPTVNSVDSCTYCRQCRWLYLL